MKEYRSTLSELIQTAVNDCIENGSGTASKLDDINENTTVYANWASNEQDIAVTISQCGCPLYAYIEQDAAGKVW